MVRFSDMLGGDGESEEARAASSPYAALASDEPEPEAEDLAAEPEAEPDTDSDRIPVATNESPEDVLDRLTQYATSARAADRVASPAPADAAEEEQAEEERAPAETGSDSEADPLRPVGDDFLPHIRGVAHRPGRGRKRHP